MKLVEVIAMQHWQRPRCSSKLGTSPPHHPQEARHSGQSRRVGIGGQRDQKQGPTHDSGFRRAMKFFERKIWIWQQCVVRTDQEIGIAWGLSALTLFVLWERAVACYERVSHMEDVWTSTLINIVQLTRYYMPSFCRLVGILTSSSSSPASSPWARKQHDWAQRTRS